MSALKIVGSQELQFTGPAHLGLVHTRLRSFGPAPWTEGDSHYYGDYLATPWKGARASGWVRIYFVGGLFYCKFRLWSQHPEGAAHDWDLLRLWVTQELLPALGAVHISPSHEID